MIQRGPVLAIFKATPGESQFENDHAKSDDVRMNALAEMRLNTGQ
jgi:hypothetical protein